jgi:tetratricopeptide (TPR) repeat protein
MAADAEPFDFSSFETDPNGEVPSVLPADGLTETEIQVFVGRNAKYYVRKWFPDFDSGTGFNGAAFLFAGLWLPYRKLYLHTLVLFGAFWLITAIEAVAVVAGGQGLPTSIGRVIGLGAGVICGAFGNRWYQKRFHRAVAEGRSRELTHASYLDFLRRRGGTNLWASLGLFVAFVMAIGVTASLPEIVAEARARRGDELWQAGELDGAIAAYTEDIRRDPNDAYALGNRGGVYVQKGDAARALPDLDRALSLGPAEADWYVNRGWAHWKLGHLDQAIADYTAAIDRRPGDAELRQWRGGIYQLRGDERVGRGELDAAIRDYAAALEDNPAEKSTVGNRGIAYVRKGDFVRGKADLDAALAAQPDWAPWFVHRATARWASDDLVGAMEDFAAAVKLDPKDWYPRLQRARILLLRQDNTAALAEFDEAIRAGADSAELRAGHGRALLRMGRYGKAADELEEALRRQPDLMSAAYDLAWLRAACPEPDLRNGPQAAKLARQICETANWSSPDFLSALAAAEAECGHFAEAVRRQEEALKISPPEWREFHEHLLTLFRMNEPYRLDDE